jgi:hypothetical protein
VVKFQETVNSVNKFFSNSPKRTRELKAIADALEEAERKFLNISATRWLSFAEAIKASVRNWEVLVAVLKDDSSQVASDLLNSVTQHSFVAIAIYLIRV